MAYSPYAPTMQPMPGQPSMPSVKMPELPTPDYLKQDPKAQGLGGGMGNMVKALMDGNNKFKAQQGGAAATGDGSWFGSSSVGGAPLAGYRGVTPQFPDANNVAMPTPMPSPRPASAPMANAPGATPPPSPFDAGTQPVPYATGPSPGVIGSNGNDPTVNALFSDIPGQNSYGGGLPFGGGMFNG